MKLSELNLQQLKSQKSLLKEKLRLTMPSNSMVSISFDTDPTKREKWMRKLDKVNSLIENYNK